MITAGYVWDEVLSIVRNTGNDVKESMKRSCQLSYYELCGLMPWLALRRKMSATLVATEAYLLPANLIGVESVYDSANYIEYFPGSAWGVIIRPTWSFIEPTEDALAILPNISVISLTTTWTGGTWAAAYIGEYIRFGKEPGIYKITAENTFAPRYYGPTLNRVTGTIRPTGIRRLGCWNDAGDRIGGAMDIYYWAYPAPLYDETQDILLPASRPLELQTLIRMLGTKDRRESGADRYRDEYVQALATMKAMNPRFVQPKEPENRMGYSAFNMNHR